MNIPRLTYAMICHLVCITPSTVWCAPAIRVEVFSDHAVTFTPRPGVSVEVFNLGELSYLRKSPPSFTGATVQEAERNAMKWKETPEFERYKNRLREAYRPLNRITHYRVMKIPAVVVEGRYVIYGTTDLDRVIDDYKTHLTAIQQNPGGGNQMDASIRGEQNVQD
jgi:integrating conjugative element protein (TIGR03757 family)